MAIGYLPRRSQLRNTLTRSELSTPSKKADCYRGYHFPRGRGCESRLRNQGAGGHAVWVRTVQVGGGYQCPAFQGVLITGAWCADTGCASNGLGVLPHKMGVGGVNRAGFPKKHSCIFQE